MTGDLPTAPGAGAIAVFVRGLSGGGAQRDAVLLANGLAAVGATSVVVTLDAKGPLRDVIDPNVALVDLGQGRKLRMLSAIPALRRYFQGQQPAVFIASEASGNLIATLAAASSPKAQRPKLVLREVASPAQARLTDPYWQNRLGYRLAPWFYPMADLVLALTEPARRDLVSHFRVPNDKAVCLGTNAVFSEADYARLSGAERHPDPNLIVAVGRLSPEKDFATLIRALARVRQTRPVRLAIAGDGPERSALEALAAASGVADAVDFLGFQADPSRVVLTAAAFVSSSLYEGFGNVIVEAMAAGTPVVATDAPYGPRAILRDGQLGRLVPVGDAAAMATAIEATLDDPLPAAVLRDAARSYTSEAAARALLELLRQKRLSAR
jgi:glycosyltransferase involved in cell wall biosynthesis